MPKVLTPMAPIYAINKPFYDVADYSVQGDGITDDTSFIQSVLNACHAAGGGIIFFPAATYKVTSTLTLFSNVLIQGSSDGGTTINMTAANTDCFSGVDLTGVSFRDITINGTGSGTGKGINLTRSIHASIAYLNFTNVTVQNFGSDGIALSNPIVSTFSRVVCATNGGYGFNFSGVISGAAGTSVSMNACYANGNTTGGYRFYNMVYTSLNGCASDNQPVNYLFDTCQSIALSGCGSEGDTTNAYKITGGYGLTLSGCWVYDNHGDAIYVTGSAHTVTLIGCTDNTPHAGATSFIKTDAGTNVALVSCNNTTANSFASGTVTTLIDGSGNMTVPGQMNVSNGATIKFGSALDTDLYRLGANSLATDGKLTVFGDTSLQGTNLGFYAATPAVKPTVSGSKGANAALTSLLAALSSLGLVTDSTT